MALYSQRHGWRKVCGPPLKASHTRGHLSSLCSCISYSTSYSISHILFFKTFIYILYFVSPSDEISIYSGILSRLIVFINVKYLQIVYFFQLCYNFCILIFFNDKFYINCFNAICSSLCIMRLKTLHFYKLQFYFTCSVFMILPDSSFAIK